MKKNRFVLLLIGLVIISSLVLLMIEKRQTDIIEGEIVQTNKSDNNNFIQAYGTAIYKVGFTSKQKANSSNQTPALFFESKVSYINNTGKLNAMGENDKFNKFNSVLLKYR